MSLSARILTAVIFLTPHTSVADETIVVKAVLNYEEKGSFFVIKKDDDFLLRTDDLLAMGIKKPEAEVVFIEGEEHISLKSLDWITFSFDESTLTLDIISAPEMLPSSIIDFSTPPRTNVFYPKHTSAFLNYGLNYAAGDSFSFQRFSLSNQFGFRASDILFYADTVYSKTDEEENFARLMTNVTYDDKNTLTRLVIGDYIAQSTAFGSTLNMAGVSFSKLYRMDPYFIKHPRLDISGFAAAPSDVELYVDGIRMMKEKISPGGFELKNIHQIYGLRDIFLVLRDQFGNERRVEYPFYFTDKLLNKGVAEYGYNAGFLREGFGVESNDYGDWAVSLFHNYGVEDFLTVGLRGEAEEGLFNLGLSAAFTPFTIGVVNSTFAFSRDKGIEGLMSSLTYTYVKSGMSANVLFNRYSRDYSSISAPRLEFDTKYEFSAGLGYGTRSLGNISLNLNSVKRYSTVERKGVSLSYSKSLTRNFSFFARANRTKEEESVNEFMFGISYYPGGDVSTSSTVSIRDGEDVELLQVSKNAPVGEGYGWRGGLERAYTDGATARRVDLSGQYNFRYGVLRGEYRTVNDAGTTDGYNLSFGGALAYVGDTLGISRPIRDSFALVSVGSIEGVPVYLNNQKVGVTDKKGRVIIPEFYSYYDNMVSVDAGDIPMDYILERVQRYVSPPFRSGSCLEFDVKGFQAIIGTLKVRLDGEIIPAQYGLMKMIVDGNVYEFPVVDGEFYIENMMPFGEPWSEKECRFKGLEGKLLKIGIHKGEFDYKGKMCAFDIAIPDTDEIYADIGELACEVKEAVLEEIKEAPLVAPALEPEGAVEEESRVGIAHPTIEVEVEETKEAPAAPIPELEIEEIKEGPAVIEPELEIEETKEAPAVMPTLEPAIEIDEIKEAPAISLVPPPPQAEEKGEIEMPEVMPTLEPAIEIEESRVGNAHPTIEIEETKEAPLVIRPEIEVFVVEPSYKGATLFLRTIHFPFDSAIPYTWDKVILDEAINLIKFNPNLDVEIHGHADQIGSDEYNLKLGERRAFYVGKYLTSKGISKDRIRKVLTFGETRLLCLSMDEGCRSKNRRAEIRLEIKTQP